jgi:hypothetical protein
MRLNLSRALYTYWNETRRGRIAPKRFEIEPSRFAEHLPDTFILERIGPGTTRFRLAGTRISDAFGFEFRGVNIYDLFGDSDRLTLERQIAVISRHGAAGVFVIKAETSRGLTADFEMSLLPLTHTNEIVDRYLGTLAPLNPVSWLGTAPLTAPRIVSHELIWPDGRPHALIDAKHRQMPFAPHIRNARIVRVDRRQFRVYDGGRSLEGNDKS